MKLAVSFLIETTYVSGGEFGEDFWTAKGDQNAQGARGAQGNQRAQNSKSKSISLFVLIAKKRPIHHCITRQVTQKLTVAQS